MEFLVLLPIVWLIVFMIAGTGRTTQDTHKRTPPPPVPWNSFRHSVSDVEGKFAVEKAFMTKRNHFAMRVKNLRTGETRTLYGQTSYEVVYKTEMLRDQWLGK